MLRKLRSGGNRAPLLVLIACDALEHRVKVLDAGADDYLIKPFEMSELLARLRALIRRAAGNPSSVIEIGLIAIDMAVRTVCKAGLPVPITATEYALVEFLALHHGKLVTRSMLHDHLFDDQDDRLSNLIEVHVSNVRRKLGKTFIATRRGHGYIIEKHIGPGHHPEYAGPLTPHAE